MKQISKKEMELLKAKGYIVPHMTRCPMYDDNDNYLGTVNKCMLKNLTITKNKYYTVDSLADDLRAGRI